MQQGSRPRLTPDARWWALIALALVTALSINPVGFIGGGFDDWQYLNAARCWREYGPCLPHDHWQARWPVVAPLAAFTSIFGESRTVVGLAPLIAAVACLVLLALIGNRMFGRPVGFLAALLMTAVPAFTMQLLEPTVEATELAFVLGGVLSLLAWEDRRSPLAAFAAGLCFSLAIQVRETAATASAFAAVYAVMRKPRSSPIELIAALIGFALPFVVEFLIFWWATGDPFWRLRLDLAHTQIPSSELDGPIDTSRGPLFNKNYIAHWKRVPGIHIHWAIDGLVNLLANALAGLSLGLTAVLLLVGRAIGLEKRRPALLLWLIAMFYACVLIYVFAIDPKARMMYVPLALSCLALASLMWQLRARTALVSTIAVVCAGVGAIELYVMPNIHRAETAAYEWIATHPGQIEIDENTRRHLTLLPAAQALPGLESDRSYLLYASAVPCNRWLRINGITLGTLHLVAEQSVTRLGWLMHSGGTPFCLFHYNRQVSGAAVGAAIQRTIKNPQHGA